MLRPEAVAFLALAYLELAEPAETANDLSLAAKMAYELLENPGDDLIFEAIADENRHQLVPLLRDLAPLSPVRVEALLHAFPPPQGSRWWGEPWATPFCERWGEVEQEMVNLVRFGIAMPRHMVNDIAESARTARGLM